MIEWLQKNPEVYELGKRLLLEMTVWDGTLQNRLMRVIARFMGI